MTLVLDSRHFHTMWSPRASERGLNTPPKASAWHSEKTHDSRALPLGVSDCAAKKRTPRLAARGSFFSCRGKGEKLFLRASGCASSEFGHFSCCLLQTGAWRCCERMWRPLPHPSSGDPRENSLSRPRALFTFESPHAYDKPCLSHGIAWLSCSSFLNPLFPRISGYYLWIRTASTDPPPPFFPPKPRRVSKPSSFTIATMSSYDFLFTSESVGEGHPDKICDQVWSSFRDRARSCLAIEWARSRYVFGYFPSRDAFDFLSEGRQWSTVW